VVNRDMETRFSWVYRKSGLAMAITSLTTCSAFLCCLSTPLVDTQGFGLFAAAVIAADYIFVMTMFCTAVMVYHNRFEKPPACSCTLPTCMGPCTCGCCLENCDCSASDPTPTQKAFAASTGEDSRPRDSIETFFRETFAPMILDPKARIAIAVVLVGWLIPAVIFVFLLTPTTEPEQFLNPNHPFQKAINVLNNNFGTNSQDPGIDLIYTWGLKNVNRDGVNLLTNASFMGKAQYEENFKFNTKCQDAIRKVCEDLKIKNTTDDYLGMIQRNKKAEGSIKCFVHTDVPKYFDDPDVEATDNNAASGLKWTNVGGTKPTGTEMPVNDDKPAHQKLAKALEGKTEFTVAEWLAFGAIDLRMGHFIKAGDNYFKPADAADRDKPETWLPGFMQMRVPDKDDEDTTSMVSISQFYGNEYMGWDGKEVKFVSISVEAKEITRWDRPGEEWMMERYTKYDDLRHNLNHIAQEACGSEVFMTEMNEKFIFMNNQMIYRTSAIRGALIGVAIAFAVLLLCTWSPLLAVCATLSILCTMMSVIGLTTMVGWDLGTVEAILISILAGFSVDYVVHLAHAYSHNYGTTSERIVATFSEMGSPVFSGMCTSVLASLPLFLCNLQFFAKFGTFLCLTIAFSWIFANFGFMSILATVGTEKIDPAKKPGESKDEGGLQAMDMSP